MRDLQWDLRDSGLTIRYNFWLLYHAPGDITGGLLEPVGFGSATIRRL